MNTPKDVTATNHAENNLEQQEAARTRRNYRSTYVAVLVCLCLVAMAIVWMLSRNANDSMHQDDDFSGKPSQRPTSAYIQTDVSSVGLEHIVAGKITTYTVDGDALDMLRNWTNNLRPAEASSGKWIIDFEDGNAPDQMEGSEVFTITVSPSDYQNGSCGFSYYICGPKEHYLLVEGNWFLVKNPSYPPVNK